VSRKDGYTNPVSTIKCKIIGKILSERAMKTNKYKKIDKIIIKELKNKMSTNKIAKNYNLNSKTIRNHIHKLLL
jgi:DNA invertase Pin-like site-specific DNA recombinase